MVLDVADHFIISLAGEGSVAALLSGRNAITISATDEDFLLVKRDIAIKLNQ